MKGNSLHFKRHVYLILGKDQQYDVPDNSE
jgi:hypothetical protein